MGMRPDLYRTVAGVADAYFHGLSAGVCLHRPVRNEIFARYQCDHAIGLWTVTSLVPSSNVASTCTCVTSSVTPVRTSSRDSTFLPELISSETDFPSRAPSTMWSEMSAIASV